MIICRFLFDLTKVTHATNLMTLNLIFIEIFRYIYEVMQALRQQYQGSLPLLSVENYLNKIEELARKNQDVDAKLYEIEDLRSNLISKHSIFDQILDVSKHKCVSDEDSCPHNLKYIMAVSLI